MKLIGSLSTNAQKIILATASALLLGLSAFIVVSGIFKSFDFTDEAWALGLIAQPENSDLNPFMFQRFVHPAFIQFGGTALVVRLLRLALSVGTAAVCSYITIRSIEMFQGRLRFHSKFNIFTFTISAAFLAWFWTPSTFGYNEMNSAVIQISILMLFAVALIYGKLGETVSTRQPLTLICLSGCIGSLSFFTKIPSFVLFETVFLIFCSTLFRKRLGSLLISIASALIFPLSFLLFSPPVVEYANRFIQIAISPDQSSSAGHGYSTFLFYIADVIINFSAVISPALLLFMTIKARSAFLVEQKSGLPFTRFLLAKTSVLVWVALALLVWIFHPFNTSGQTNGRIVVALVSAAALILVIKADFLSKVAPNRPSVLYIGVIAVLTSPLVNSFGTNVILSAHIGHAGIAIGCLLVFAIYTRDPRLHKSDNTAVYSRQFQILALTLICFLALIKSAALPYRAQSIFDPNTKVVDFGLLKGMALGKEELKFVTWLWEQNQTLSSESAPAISLASPGALVLFNNSGFASSWIEYPNKIGYQSVENSCQKFKPSEVFLILPTQLSRTSPAFRELDAALSSCQLNVQDAVVISTNVSPRSEFAYSILKAKADN